MAVNIEELKTTKTTDELLAIIESQDRKLSEVAPAPVPVASAAPVAPVAEPVKKLTEQPAAAPVVAEPKKLTEVAIPEDKELSEIKNTVKKLSEENQQLKERNRVSDIDMTLNAYEQKGMPPVVISKMRELMLSDKEITGTYKLSEQSDGKVNEISITLSEAIVRLADVIPLIELNEQTVIQSNGSSDPSANVAESDFDKVKKFSDEKKVSFREATATLIANGTIQKPSFGYVPKD